MFYELSDKRNIIHEQCMKIAHYAICDLLTLTVLEHPFTVLTSQYPNQSKYCMQLHNVMVKMKKTHSTCYILSERLIDTFNPFINMIKMMWIYKMLSLTNV